MVGKIFEAIVNLPKSIIDGFLGMLKWAFYVDFNKIMSKVDFQQKMNSKFSFLKDFQNASDSIFVSELNDYKFFIDLPEIFGGGKVTILDLTLIKPVLDFAKNFLKVVIWGYFVRYLFDYFSPKFNIS